MLHLLSIASCWGQSVTQEGRISYNRNEFINRIGQKSSLEGVKTTGQINPSNCQSITINHVTSRGVAPINRSITYTLKYVTLSGRSTCWLQQNLGATAQATTAYDASDAAAGWNWQWGRKQGFQIIGTTRTPNTSWITADFTPDNVDWPTASDPCTIELGSGWRLPTFNEWEAFTLIYGTTNNAYNSELKVHNAGWLQQTTGLLQERGQTAHFWSSDNGNVAGHAKGFSIPIQGGNTTVSNNDKNAGFSVRCIRD